MISDIEIMMNDSTSLFESITNNLKLWRSRIDTQKQFREEWNDFVLKTRRLIQTTTEIEESFFVKLFSEFGSSSSADISQTYQKRLDELMPTVKV